MLALKNEKLIPDLRLVEADENSLSEPLLVFENGPKLRRRYFTPESFEHPARLNIYFAIWLIERYSKPGDTITDPMAGVGTVLIAALLQRNLILREVEEKWVKMLTENAKRIQSKAGLFAGEIDIAKADARQPWDFECDLIITSPPYGCAASRTKESRSLETRIRRVNANSYDKRWTYLANKPSPGAVGAETFFYGNDPNQIGHLRGKKYWEAMTEVYQQAQTSLRPGGLLILVLKDHIRSGVQVHTCDQTVELCQSLGFELVARHKRYLKKLSLWQRRRREQGLPVIDIEEALVFRKVGS